jgi:hypothetical protein
MTAQILVLLGLVGAETDGLRATEPGPAVAAPSPGRGEESSDAHAAAQAALALGNKRLKEGDITGAIDEYRRAQTIYPPAAAKLEFNIAKAEETRGDEPAAAAAFERFLSQSLEIPPEYREEARNELHRLSTALGTLKLTEKRPGYDVVVDGQVQGKTPLEGGVWVRPGHHVLTLEEDEHVMFRDDVDVSGGATVQITVTIRHGAELAAPGAPPALTSPAARADALLPSSSQLVRAQDSGRDGNDERAPVWTRWWFWAATGAVVATGATLLILSTRGTDCPASSCKTVTLQAP